MAEHLDFWSTPYRVYNATDINARIKQAERLVEIARRSGVSPTPEIRGYLRCLRRLRFYQEKRKYASKRSKETLRAKLFQLKLGF